MKIGILCIATGNYKSFVQRLVNGIEKNFLPDHEREIYLFTDQEMRYKSGLKITQTIIPSYKFPEATMLRYHIFSENDYDGCDYLFYTDVDMGFIDKIGEDVLGDIVAVQHPGFYKRDCNSWEKNKNSACYISEEKRVVYCAGGFQGGAWLFYKTAISTIKSFIKHDLNKGITPIWHDETGWNKFLSEIVDYKLLSPEYCMPESMQKRKNWGLAGMKPKILALEKDFKFMRR